MIKESFIKKYSTEQDILFYIHFEDDTAVRQIEVFPGGNTVRLTVNLPVLGESMLYDQSLSDLDLEITDFISRSEFENVWGSDKPRV